MFVLRKLDVYLIKPNKHTNNNIYYISVAYQLNCRYLANHTTHSTRVEYRFLSPGHGDGVIDYIVVDLPTEYRQDISNNIRKSILAYKPKGKYIVNQINMYKYKYVYSNNSITYDIWGENTKYQVDIGLIAKLNARFKYIQI
jgi:hypothetical protein